MSQKYKRIFLIVLDSVGMGDAADAADYGDKGADTLAHIAEHMTAFKIPNLVKLGLANLKPMAGVTPADYPLGIYTALNERSSGKDTMTGHWEMMGIYTTQPFVTFTDTGFPKELIEETAEGDPFVFVSALGMTQPLRLSAMLMVAAASSTGMMPTSTGSQMPAARMASIHQRNWSMSQHSWVMM